MKFSKREIIVSVVLIMVLFGLYIRRQFFGQDTGMAYNSERIKLGVPTIGESWRMSSAESWLTSSKTKTWYNPDTTLPRHVWKELTITGGRLEIEHDDFEFLYDGRRALLISYYHHDDHCFNLYFDDGLGDVSKKISCAEADSILISQKIQFRFGSCKVCDQ